MTQQSRYIVGIDLGTTNSAMAYIDRAAKGRHGLAVHDFPVPQLVAPGEALGKRLLPSNAYLPGEHELPPEATRLPWGGGPPIVGELAKLQGARVPGRMVASAKSWLCHAGVERTAKILPWGAPEGVKRISPVAASALYLGHLRAAWDHSHPESPLAQQDVVLTVPASFDEVARELTVQAAKDAGLLQLTLVEEPQAAFYWWTARHRQKLAEALGSHRLILVVDVGGGTSDFTLIHAAPGEQEGVPKLTRIAVGDHILLGGDNIDVTLARSLEPKLGGRIDASQWSLLVAACRAAKEALLAEGGPPKATVAVAGRSSRLIGGTLSAELTRDEVLRVVLDGFFPQCAADELPARQKRTGLQELGLPYASEPAVTRHVAAFLRGHAAEIEEALGEKAGAGRLPRPDAILLNGGVFTPAQVGVRLQEAVSAWFPEREPVALLQSDSLELVVARGAAWYGLVRRGKGLRITGGTARAYYVGIDAPPTGDAAAKPGQQLLCVLPRHLEEGARVDVPRTFALVLGRPVRFPLYATSHARSEQPGELCAFDEETFVALPPIETVLRESKALKEKRYSDFEAGTRPAAPADEVPVRLRAVLTELGTLELHCVSTEVDTQWKLEFQLRVQADERAAELPAGPGADGIASASPAGPPAALHKRFSEAKEAIIRIFSQEGRNLDDKEVRGLPKALEAVLGPRPEWPTPLVRELWAGFHEVRAHRRHSPDHERVWMQLAGFCLRPGFGAPHDDWRAAETFKLWSESLQFPDEAATWSAWWIFWRRVLGGLDAASQKRILEKVTPQLKPLPEGIKRKPGDHTDGVEELIRMVGSLERLDVASKVQAGLWLVERAEREGPQPHTLWAIGRLGARVPFYGQANACVPPPQAAAWAKRLLGLQKARAEDLVLPLAQLARLSGDRARDLEPAIRARVEQRLVEAKAPELLLRFVREVVVPGSGEEQRVFGESLPSGLKLLG